MSEMKFGLASPYSVGYSTGTNTAWDLITGKFDQIAYDNAIAELNERKAILDNPETNSLDRESYGAELRFWEGVIRGMDSERNRP